MYPDRGASVHLVLQQVDLSSSVPHSPEQPSPPVRSRGAQGTCRLSLCMPAHSDPAPSRRVSLNLRATCRLVEGGSTALVEAGTEALAKLLVHHGTRLPGAAAALLQQDEARKVRCLLTMHGLQRAGVLSSASVSRQDGGVHAEVQHPAWV